MVFSRNNIYPETCYYLSKDEIAYALQGAIETGKSAFVKELSEIRVNLEEPLPNGELPLLFAVKSNQPEVVQILLEEGVDPNQSDKNSKKAIDYAISQGSEALLALLLPEEIDATLKQMESKTLSEKVSAVYGDLFSRFLKFNSLEYEQQLSPLSRSALEGDFDTLVKFRGNVSELNRLDPHGFAPIHYAILGGHVEVVIRLCELGADPNLLTAEGENLLHLAVVAARNRNKMIEEVLEGWKGEPIALKNLVNGQNKNGETPLHYAARQYNGRFLCLYLSCFGGDLQVQNHKEITPLELFFYNKKSEELAKGWENEIPLHLPSNQVLLLLSIASAWLIKFGESNKYINEPADATFISLVIQSALAASTFDTENVSTKQAIKEVTKKFFYEFFKNYFFTATSVFASQKIPPLSLFCSLFTIWRVAQLAPSMFKSFKSTWEFRQKHPWTAARNFAVLGINTLDSGHKLYQSCQTTFNFSKEYFKNIRGLFKDKGLGSALKSLTNRERILSPKLDPTNPEHALLMISPNFTIHQLKTEGASLYAKSYRSLMVTEIHPDKGGNDPSVQEAAARLNAAYTTLNTLVKDRTFSLVNPKYIPFLSAFEKGWGGAHAAAKRMFNQAYISREKQREFMEDYGKVSDSMGLIRFNPLAGGTCYGQAHAFMLANPPNNEPLHFFTEEDTNRALLMQMELGIHYLGYEFEQYWQAARSHHILEEWNRENQYGEFNFEKWTEFWRINEEEGPSTLKTAVSQKVENYWKEITPILRGKVENLFFKKMTLRLVIENFFKSPSTTDLDFSLEVAERVRALSKKVSTSDFVVSYWFDLPDGTSAGHAILVQPHKLAIYDAAGGIFQYESRNQLFEDLFRHLSGLKNFNQAKVQQYKQPSSKAKRDALKREA